jgi:hypothetical protein
MVFGFVVVWDSLELINPLAPNLGGFLKIWGTPPVPPAGRILHLFSFGILSDVHTIV